MRRARVLSLELWRRGPGRLTFRISLLAIERASLLVGGAASTAGGEAPSSAPSRPRATGTTKPDFFNGIRRKSLLLETCGPDFRPGPAPTLVVRFQRPGPPTCSLFSQERAPGVARRSKRKGVICLVGTTRPPYFAEHP